MKSKNLLIFTVLLLFSINLQSQKTITLNPPDTTRGLPVMKALNLRASANEFDTTSLSLEDLSDLCWAANGINRVDKGKRTAPSAMNAQDIDVYICLKTGVYLYNPNKQQLEIVCDTDCRHYVADQQAFVEKAPVICLLVSDISKFPRGDDAQKMTWAAEDAGIVSQNISVFCASVGLATRVRASMNQQKLRELLKLKDSQKLILNNPVGYGKRI